MPKSNKKVEKKIEIKNPNEPMTYQQAMKMYAVLKNELHYTKAQASTFIENLLAKAKNTAATNETKTAKEEPQADKPKATKKATAKASKEPNSKPQAEEETKEKPSKESKQEQVKFCPFKLVSGKHWAMVNYRFADKQLEKIYVQFKDSKYAFDIPNASKEESKKYGVVFVITKDSENYIKCLKAVNSRAYYDLKTLQEKGGLSKKELKLAEQKTALIKAKLDKETAGA